MESDQLQVELVIEWLEERLSDGEFNIVDFWLKHAELEALGDAAIIGALTMSYWGKDKLTQRDSFLKRAEPVLKERLGEDRAERLLRFRR